MAKIAQNGTKNVNFCTKWNQNLDKKNHTKKFASWKEKTIQHCPHHRWNKIFSTNPPSIILIPFWFARKPIKKGFQLRQNPCNYFSNYECGLGMSINSSTDSVNQFLARRTVPFVLFSMSCCVFLFRHP